MELTVVTAIGLKRVNDHITAAAAAATAAIVT